MIVVTPATFKDALVSFGKRLSSVKVFREFIDEAAEVIRADVRENFQTSTDIFGGAALPLSKPRAGGGSQPLMASRELYNSLAGRGVGHIERKTQNSLTFGTSVSYARKQFMGGTTSPTNVKNLAIPLTRQAELSRARQFPSVLRVAVRDGRAVGLVDEDGQFQYVFPANRSVRNPPRRMFGWGPRLIRKLRAAYVKVAKKAFREKYG